MVFVSSHYQINCDGIPSFLYAEGWFEYFYFLYFVIMTTLNRNEFLDEATQFLSTRKTKEELESAWFTLLDPYKLPYIKGSNASSLNEVFQHANLPYVVVKGNINSVSGPHVLGKWNLSLDDAISLLEAAKPRLAEVLNTVIPGQESVGLDGQYLLYNAEHETFVIDAGNRYTYGYVRGDDGTRYVNGWHLYSTWWPSVPGLKNRKIPYLNPNTWETESGKWYVLSHGDFAKMPPEDRNFKFHQAWRWCESIIQWLKSLGVSKENDTFEIKGGIVDDVVIQKFQDWVNTEGSILTWDGLNNEQALGLDFVYGFFTTFKSNLEAKEKTLRYLPLFKMGEVVRKRNSIKIDYPKDKLVEICALFDDLKNNQK